MKVQDRNDGDVRIISLAGKVMGGSESVGFHQTVNSAVEANVKKVIIDLGDVDWMGSAGLGLLVAALARLRNVGGELRLARLNPKVESIFALNKLNLIFSIHPTIEAATASFPK